MFEVIIGNPIVESKELGFTEKAIHTNERFLPRILVEIGVFSSNNEVRKNRPDLFIELNELSMLSIEVGKKHIDILVGE